MDFGQHTRRNWLITLLAAIFLGAATTMIFLDNPYNTIVIAAVFAASSVVLFGIILGIWYLVQRRGKKDDGTHTDTAHTDNRHTD